MTLVRFLKGYRSYNSGETAGFDADTSLALIAAGIAVAFDPVEPDLVEPVEPDPVEPVEPDPVDSVDAKPKQRGG